MTYKNRTTRQSGQSNDDDEPTTGPIYDLMNDEELDEASKRFESLLENDDSPEPEVD